MSARPRAAALAVRAALVSVLACGTLTACGSDEEGLRYATDYAGHEPLGVVGYPTFESLRITQQLVWRLADGKAEEVEGLAEPGDAKGDVERTARNWIRSFHEGAKGKVTAEFYDEGSVWQLVVVYFHDTGQAKAFTVRLTGRAGEEGWHVTMREPDPKEASATLDWLPRLPGALGSKTPR